MSLREKFPMFRTIEVSSYSGSRSIRRLHYPEDEGTMISQNIRKRSLNVAAPHPKILGSCFSVFSNQIDPPQCRAEIYKLINMKLKLFATHILMCVSPYIFVVQNRLYKQMHKF